MDHGRPYANCDRANGLQSIVKSVVCDRGSGHEPYKRNKIELKLVENVQSGLLSSPQYMQALFGSYSLVPPSPELKFKKVYNFFFCGKLHYIKWCKIGFLHLIRLHPSELELNLITGFAIFFLGKNATLLSDARCHIYT